MQVKKFYATSIAQALQEIKEEFGPEAIILSSTENHGSRSEDTKFVIVAAVSEVALQKKRFTESKLGAQNEIFQRKAASVQREIIGSVVKKKTKAVEKKNRPRTQRRYAEIDDDQASTEDPRVQVFKTPARQKIGVARGKADSALASHPAKKRVEKAVKDVFKSDLATQFFQSKKPSSTERKNIEPKSGVIPPTEKSSVDQQGQRDFKARYHKKVSRAPSQVPSLGERAEAALKKTTVVADITAENPSSTITQGVDKVASKLLSAGVEKGLVKSLIQKALMTLGRDASHGRLDARVGTLIMEKVQTVSPNQFSGIEFFVGPQGMGKTTALLMLAAQYRMKTRRRIGIVSTDLGKVGSFETLKVYSRILDIPLWSVNSIHEWKKHRSHFESFDNVLVDTPGVHLHSQEELSFLRLLTSETGSINGICHLVLSAAQGHRNLASMIGKFSLSTEFDLIFTHLDSTQRHGPIINIINAVPKPLHSFGRSQDCIDGFEWATKERVLDLIYKLTQKYGETNHEPQV